MAVLIIKNILNEGPGTIGDFLKEEDIPFTIVELWSGEIPPSLEDFNTIVITGGPMSVYEMEKYPHLRIESRLIREAINRDMKVFGICLGAQMIAYCLGSNVYRGTIEEIGWHHIELTGDGIKDPLMRRLALHPLVGDFWRKFNVFHWHNDTFEIPVGAVLLASSELYKNQAFRFKNNVYGFQFHIEVTKEMIKEWFGDRPELNSIMNETDRIFEEYSGRARNFYKTFFRM
ncbi:MAG: type 1 glutamine amidotransferase [Thermodesulfovibrionales bacterium]